MRQKRTNQASLELNPVDHPLAEDMARMSAFLDEHPEFADWVAADLSREGVSDVGRQGMTHESALRCGVLKQMRRESYRDLAFALRDSATAQSFARLDGRLAPGKSALQAAVGSVSAATWERINGALLAAARSEGVEDGSQVRVDSTVTETDILSPTDSGLLRDAVRVLTRLLETARERLGREAVAYRDHRRAAQRRMLEIHSRRGAAHRAERYRALLRLTARTVGYAEAARAAVAEAREPWAAKWSAAMDDKLALTARVVDQTRRRVLDGETVPASEKIVSLFEPHTDIVVKGRRGTEYGHKVNLTTGRSGLVLDAVVEDGNPADSSRALPMLERVAQRYGAAPAKAAFDGGYASKENLDGAKALGVKHAVFSKKRGIKRADMTPSAWQHGALKRFRAGAEACISYLKRCFGLARCRWRGLPRFRAWVQSAVVAHNLLRFARLRPKPT